MYNRRRQMKSEEIADDLRGKIIDGVFVSGRLPPKSELMLYYHVSHTPLEKALGMLVSEGLIYGVRGTGIFVNKGEPQREVNLTHRLVMVVMSHSGHYYSELYGALREALLLQSLYPVGYAIKDSLLNLSNASHFLSAPIKGVIYHGLSSCHYPFLQNGNLKSVALDWYDQAGTPPGGAALVDYAGGSYQLARHFLAHGCRRLVLLSHPLPQHPADSTCWDNHVVMKLKRGIMRAVEECGTATMDLNEVDMERKEEMERVVWKDYDGVICTSDFLAYHYGVAAAKIGKRCPEDYFLSGCYDTPWSSQAGLSITSLAPDISRMAQTAVELLNRGSSEQVVIPPAIRWRESTGLLA